MLIIWLHRYGLGTTAILLARSRLGRVTTTGNAIWVDGTSVHALCIVCWKSCLGRHLADDIHSATASKVNWITLVTGVTHEKLQVFHRWISYAFFVLALMHTFPFIVYHVRHHDMVEQVTSGLVFYWTGIVALVLQAWLTIASFSTIR